MAASSSRAMPLLRTRIHPHQSLAPCCRRRRLSSSASSSSRHHPLPPQLARLPPPKPQPSLAHALLNSDPSSSTSQAILRDASNRRSNFGSAHLEQLHAKQTRRKVVSHQMNEAGRKAAEAQKAFHAFLKANKGKEKKRVAAEEDRLRSEARSSSHELAKLREEHDELSAAIAALLLASPNGSHAASPVGPESKAQVVALHAGVNCWLPSAQRRAYTLAKAGAERGEPVTLEQWDQEAAATQQDQDDQPSSSSPQRTHLGLASLLAPSGQIDMPAGRLSTGPSFPYLTDSIALLEQALLRYATDVALERGFRLVSAPVVVKTDVAERCGFDPRGGEGGQTYFVSSSSDLTPTPAAADQQQQQQQQQHHSDLCLVGTAEIALAALVSGRTFPRANLPLRLLAISPSFRAEAGGRGKETKGLYRLHQFNKAEMFVVAAPPSLSPHAAEAGGEGDLLEELRSIQETVLGQLGLTTRTLAMPTEELGASAHRKYDIEAWMPGRSSSGGGDAMGGAWGEVSSASDCTDYQSSRLAINVVSSPPPAAAESTEATTEGKKKGKAPPQVVPAHTYNATLLAAPRVIIALLEQYGVDEVKGRLRLPVSLREYWPGGRGKAGEEQVEWVALEGGEVAASPSRPAGPQQQQQQQQTRSYSTSSSSSPPPPPPRQPLMHRLRSQLLALSSRTGTDPASLTASFLILHELTAILPLVAFFYLLGFLGLGEAVCQWFLSAAAQEGVEGKEVEEVAAWRRKVGEWLNEGMMRTERYARRKGWWGLDKEEGSDGEGHGNVLVSGGGAFANAVAAYVLTKALVAPRLLLSFYLSPAFARGVFEPAKRVVVKVMARRRGGGAGGAGSK